jgi:hypothetical protein
VADPFGPRNCGQSPQVPAAGKDIRRPVTITDRILMIGSTPAEFFSPSPKRRGGIRHSTTHSIVHSVTESWSLMKIRFPATTGYA